MIALYILNGPRPTSCNPALASPLAVCITAVRTFLCYVGGSTCSMYKMTCQPSCLPPPCRRQPGNGARLQPCATAPAAATDSRSRSQAPRAKRGGCRYTLVVAHCGERERERIHLLCGLTTCTEGTWGYCSHTGLIDRLQTPTTNSPISSRHITTTYSRPTAHLLQGCLAVLVDHWVVGFALLHDPHIQTPTAHLRRSQGQQFVMTAPNGTKVSEDRASE